MARAEIAVTRGGQTVIVQALPKHLVAFCDEVRKNAPETVKELASLARLILGETDVPLSDWIAGLDDISSATDDLEEARQKLRGAPGPSRPTPATEALPASGGGA